jgi:hypothetical protein
LTSKEIVLQSIDILIAKCRKHLDELDGGRNSGKLDPNRQDLQRASDEAGEGKRLY